MNHKYDSQLKIIKDYYKNTIQYHRHNTHKLSLSLPKKISKRQGRTVEPLAQLLKGVPTQW